MYKRQRLIDLDEYKIAGGEMLYGFVAGLLASNYAVSYTHLKGSGASLYTELTLPEELEAPVDRGQTLGKAAVYQGEALLEEYEVLSLIHIWHGWPTPTSRASRPTT